MGDIHFFGMVDMLLEKWTPDREAD